MRKVRILEDAFREGLQNKINSYTEYLSKNPDVCDDDYDVEVEVIPVPLNGTINWFGVITYNGPDMDDDFE